MEQVPEQIQVKQAIDRFHKIMAMQQSANKSAQKRISFIYKVVLAGFLFVLVAFVGTAYVMTTQMHKGTDSLRFMNQNMVKISSQMLQMNQTMLLMQQDMQSMNDMVRKINTMTRQVGSMNQSIQGINDEMTSVRQNVEQVSMSMKKMNTEFYHMQGSVYRLGGDIDNITKPMRMFNKVNPFKRNR